MCSSDLGGLPDNSLQRLSRDYGKSCMLRIRGVSGPDRRQERPNFKRFDRQAPPAAMLRAGHIESGPSPQFKQRREAIPGGQHPSRLRPDLPDSVYNHMACDDNNLAEARQIARCVSIVRACALPRTSITPSICLEEIDSVHALTQPPAVLFNRE